MRLVKTFVLRLYVDTETPERLCGDLQAMPDRQLHLFKSETGLVDLLIRLVKTLIQNPSLNQPSEKEIQASSQ